MSMLYYVILQKENRLFHYSTLKLKMDSDKIIRDMSSCSPEVGEQKLWYVLGNFWLWSSIEIHMKFRTSPDFHDMTVQVECMLASRALQPSFRRKRHWSCSSWFWPKPYGRTGFPCICVSLPAPDQEKTLQENQKIRKILHLMKIRKRFMCARIRFTPYKMAACLVVADIFALDSSIL